MFNQNHKTDSTNQAVDDKLNREIAKIEEINSSIYDFKTKIARHNEKLSLLSEEIKYYEDMLCNNNNYNTTENENLLIKKEETEEEGYLNEDDDELKIYQKLNSVLKEFSEDYHLAKINDHKKEEASIKFYTVCVIFLEFDEDNRSNKKYQTFRLSSKTTIHELQEICQNFWDIRLTDNPHFHFTDEEIVIKLSEEKKQENIEKIMKDMNNIKKTTFVLSYNEKLRVEEIFEKKQTPLTLRAVPTDSLESYEIQNLFSKFVGLKTKMINKFHEIKNKEKSDSIKNVSEEKNNYKQLTLRLSAIITFILIFVFTLINLSNIRPTEESFYMRLAYEKQFAAGNRYTSVLDLNNSIINMTNLLFYETEGNLISNNTNILINSIRISYYKTTQLNCSLVSNQICYNEIYNTKTAETKRGSSYLSDANYINDTEFFPNEYLDSLSDYFVILDSNGDNYLSQSTDYQILYNYLENLFSTATTISQTNLQTNFVGNFGIYRGTSNLDLFISSTFINLNVFKTINNIVLSSKNNFNIDSIRGVTIDFVLLNPQSGYYFYISIILEKSPLGGVTSPIITIRPFLLNIYSGNFGGIMFSLDIARLIFILILILFSFFISKNRKENFQITKGNLLKSMISLIDSKKLIINISIFIIYCICISIKMSSLQNTLPALNTTSSYLSLSLIEYFEIVYNYEMCILLESIIIFLLICEIIIFLDEFKTLRIFTDYILASFTKIIQIFLLILFILISYSIFANNIWGQNYDSYKDFGFSLVYCFMFSVGHFDTTIFNYEFTIWNVIFTLMFFVVFVFFIHTTLPGVFMELYRINSLSEGYFYEKSILASLDDRQIEKKNKIKKVQISY